MKHLLFLPLFILCSINIISGQNTLMTISPDSTAAEKLIKATDEFKLGSTIKLCSEDFNKGVIFTPMELIKGRVPGFIINSLNSKDPNPNLEIQLRGTSTLFLSIQPLYILDGIPVENVDFIAPENIESIEVLKSLSETASYGIRGGNGVVIINTKKSSSNKFTINYSTYFYMESFSEKSDYLSADEWRQLKTDWAVSTNTLNKSYSQKMGDYNSSTEWIKEISQQKLSFVHNLGISGGINKTTYAANINFTNHSGIIKKTANNAFKGQLSISQLALKDKLKVDLSFSGAEKKYSQINDSPYLNYGTTIHSIEEVYSNIINRANLYNPTVPVYNDDGTFKGDTNFFGEIRYNPVDLINRTDADRFLTNYITSILISYELIKGLKLSFLFSEHKNDVLKTDTYRDIIGNKSYLKGREETNDSKEKINNIKIVYNKSIRDHNFSLNVAYLKQHNEYSYYYKDSLYSSKIESYSWSKNDGEYDIQQISGLVKYNYADKYFAYLGLLQEKSKLYKPGKESSQYFPSVTVGWSLTNEEVLKNVKWLNEFFFRAGFGKSQRNLSRPLYSDFFNSTLYPEHGENLREISFGFDAALWSKRFNFSIDYFNRITNDGVLLINGLKELGLGWDAEMVNNSKNQNNGLELYIKAKPYSGPLKWTINFNISYYMREFIKWTGTTFANYKCYVNHQYVEGNIGNFYGFPFAGYNDHNLIMVYDSNGIATTKTPIVRLNRLGNGVPALVFGLNNYITYKNLSLSLDLRGGLGFHIKNYEYYYYSNLNFNSFKKNISSIDMRNLGNRDLHDRTDYSIEKGDYVKIDNITLSYSFSKMPGFLKSSEAYISCNNIFTFTKFTGGDPETAGTTGAEPGYYFYEKYPNTRLFVLGLRIAI